MLTCGHRLCDHCIRVYCRSSEHSYFDLPNCLLCGREVEELIYVKPSAAGLRILRLSGGIRDATNIAHVLQSLRYLVRAPLHEHFDVVLASGIGIFFAIMIFGKKSSIEDCMYHIPNIKHARIKTWGFSFGSRLKFERKELQSNKVSILQERYSKFRRRMIRLFANTEGSKNNRSSDLCLGARIDCLVDCCVQQPKELCPLIGEKLIASLFYPELSEVPCIHLGRPAVIAISIRCRLGPGPYLADLILRMQRGRVLLGYHGDSTPMSVELCTGPILSDIRAGRPFHKLVYIRAQSSGSVVSLYIYGGTGMQTSFQNISNCPCSLDVLAEAHISDRQKQSHLITGQVLIEEVDRLRIELSHLMKH